jgi:hypothetical protein
MLLVGVVSLCACVGVASATVTKISAFMPAGSIAATDCDPLGGASGQTANPDVDGTGTVKFNASTGGFTRLHLEISDLEPNTPYSIMVESSTQPFAQTLLDAFITNPAGHGVYMTDTVLEGDWSTAPVITVFKWDHVVVDNTAVHVGDRDTLDCSHETRAVSVVR